MKNMKELGYSGYSISSTGQVYSLLSSSLLNGWVGSTGYRQVSLKDDSTGKFRQVFVHRLVAKMYISDTEELQQVNHIDGDKLNNDVNNLEWVTCSENTQHAHDHLLNKGKNFNPEATIKNEQIIADPYEDKSYKLHSECEIRQICHLIEQGYRDVDICRITGFNRRFINTVRHKEAASWLHVISQYNFHFKKEERLSPETVLLVCKDLEEGRGVMETARKFNLCRKTVGNIKNRKTFKDLSRSFNFQ